MSLQLVTKAWKWLRMNWIEIQPEIDAYLERKKERKNEQTVAASLIDCLIDVWHMVAVNN